ncbi:hypothetical protein [Saccharothrix australiensis]|uniref:Sel1 repeat-containing protein n=1 Tax=Saccharothrix australiensis TaxID=2072 RepID=A0A495VT64_9PSEU|nr:hypothetical protein [Saccharothrix australiensis]RKT52529.1 hypothetical protein C8E97_1046 [Saccharothrix australiensis]
MTDRAALHAAARSGDADAMVELALLLAARPDDGGGSADEVERWLGHAARTGHVRGVAEYGAFLWHVRKSGEAALPWLRRAAEAGEVGAMAVLGDVHDFLGDTEAAKRWYAAAAERGDEAAADSLAALDRLTG